MDTGRSRLDPAEAGRATAQRNDAKADLIAYELGVDARRAPSEGQSSSPEEKKTRATTDRDRQTDRQTDGQTIDTCFLSAPPHDFFVLCVVITPASCGRLAGWGPHGNI